MYNWLITPYIKEVVEKMMKCREPGPNGLGYHKFQCPIHKDVIRVVPHTCKTKICTTCAAIQSDVWTEELKQRFPREKYFHITLTMPEQFRDFFGPLEDRDWKRKSDLYELAWKAVRGFFRKQNLLSGGMIVLHTFGRALNVNPHVHMVIPAGGLLHYNGYSWKKVKFISETYISHAWRKNLLDYIFHNDSYFKPHADEILTLLERKDLDVDKCKKLYKLVEYLAPEKDRDKWWKVLEIPYYYVQAAKKAEFNEPMCYISRYARRLPVSKSKIIKWDEKTQMVTWEYNPHYKNISPVTSTMHAHQFMGRMITHIPPKNFRLVRYYGIFSSKNYPKYHPILKRLCQFIRPKRVPTWRERILAYTGEDPLVCPCCHKDLELVEKANPDKVSGRMKITAVKNS